jgi:hypothetical protein
VIIYFGKCIMCGRETRLEAELSKHQKRKLNRYNIIPESFRNKRCSTCQGALISFQEGGLNEQTQRS